MGKKSIKRNYIYNTLYQIFKIITPLATAPYVSRVLNADGVGIYSYIAAIVSNFMIFSSLGTGTYGQREISYYQDDTKKRSIYFWEIEILNICSVSVTVIIYLFFSLRQTSHRFIYLICVFQLIAIAFDISWLFIGLEDFSKIVFRDIFVKLVSLVGIFLLVRTYDDLWKYALLLSLLPFFSSISLWFFLPSYIKRVPISVLKPFRHLKGTISLFIPTIAVQVYSVLDKVMLGFITKDAFENGYYEQAFKIVRIILTIVVSLGTVLIPRIGYYFINKNMDGIKKSLQKSINFVWFLSCPLCFGLISCASNFVPWFFGENYIPMIPLLQVLSVLIIVIGLNNITGMQILIPTKRHKEFTITVLLGAIVNVILNLILIPNYKAFGATVSSVLAESVVLLSELFMLKKDYSFSLFFGTSKNYIIASIFMVIVLKVEKIWLSTGLVSFSFMIITGGFVYLCILLFLKDDFFIFYTRDLFFKIFDRIVIIKKINRNLQT